MNKSITYQHIVDYLTPFLKEKLIDTDYSYKGKHYTVTNVKVNFFDVDYIEHDGNRHVSYDELKVYVEIVDPKSKKKNPKWIDYSFGY